jgi:subtilisin family serine protease
MSKNAKLHIESLENRALLTSSIVAIIDSGMDYNHPDLADNLWINPSDKIDGIDNDRNGYIDDNIGWDFVDSDNSPKDGFYHGTHVAGIVATIDPNVKIMPLRFQNDQGMGYTGAAVTAINYAVDMKLRGHNVSAINLSWGGGTSVSLGLQSAIKRASDNGIVVVIAAGNNASDNDIVPRYPSSYRFDNTISVAAINPDKSLAGFSNYGKNSVDVAAPGTNILSTLPNGGYGYVSGTSMAAPYVSGLVSLLRNIKNYAADQIKRAIIYGAEVTGFVRYGIVSIEKSLSIDVGPSTIIINPPPVITPTPTPIKLATATVSTVSKKLLTGMVHDGYGNIVVKINNIVRYSANDISGSFRINMNKKYFNKRINSIEVLFKDIQSQEWKTICYKRIK